MRLVVALVRVPDLLQQLREMLLLMIVGQRKLPVQIDAVQLICFQGARHRFDECHAVRAVGDHREERPRVRRSTDPNEHLQIGVRPLQQGHLAEQLGRDVIDINAIVGVDQHNADVDVRAQKWIDLARVQFVREVERSWR